MWPRSYTPHCLIARVPSAVIAMAQEWKKESLKLKKRHGWKSRPGNLICVIGRGAIRFDYPEGWLVSPEEGQLNIRDKAHPNDSCVLAVSQMHLPPVADLAPLDELVRGTIQEEKRPGRKAGDVVEISREDGVQIAYA